MAVLTIDSGCEGDCIKLDCCHRLGIQILPLDKDDNKVPTLADGKSPLEIVGQVKFTAVRGNVKLVFEGYVAKELNADILCGAPFMERNKLVQELHNKCVVVDGKHRWYENSPFCPNVLPEVAVHNVAENNNEPFRSSEGATTNHYQADQEHYQAD